MSQRGAARRSALPRTYRPPRARNDYRAASQRTATCCGATGSGSPRLGSHKQIRTVSHSAELRPAEQQATQVCHGAHCVRPLRACLPDRETALTRQAAGLNRTPAHRTDPPPSSTPLRPSALRGRRYGYSGGSVSRPKRRRGRWCASPIRGACGPRVQPLIEPTRSALKCARHASV